VKTKENACFKEKVKNVQKDKISWGIGVVDEAKVM
jgi:hypothetical protein